MGVKRPRQYTGEFKEQAVRLAKELGSVKKAAARLGIPEATVHGWRWRANKNAGKLRGSAGALTADSPEEEIKRLRKENDELKKANHILKRAAAFFSQDHLK
jgi:transposase